MAWLDTQVIGTLYLSAITVAELRYGLATMPEGKRRTTYQERLTHEVLPTFANRVLPFDLVASQAYADLMAQAKALGRAIGKSDGYIAAVAVAKGLRIATRDINPFEAAGLTVINPWQA